MRVQDEDVTSATIFVVLRRMRAPLIVLISVFAIGTLGLSLIPGVDAAGNRVYLTPFDSFYVMSYTATTIGFGEIPHPFTPAQRLWVTVCIYLTVIGWAYAIGTLLSLLQDRGYRQVRALQRFRRKVRGLNEPFLLLVGYGRAGEIVVRAFDDMGQRVVVVDADSEQIDSLDLGSFRAEIPGLAADAADPRQLRRAGLTSPHCVGVLALTGDDQANLSVVMAAGLLRPELPVVTHTTSDSVAAQMHAIGTPMVIDPFDRFGDYLRLALHAPASYQLLTWLSDGPGATLPERGRPPTRGRWVVCGHGRLGHDLVRDLRDADVQLTVIEHEPSRASGLDDITVVIGDAADPSVLARANVAEAVGLIAGTDDDVTNLSILASTRKMNAHAYLAGRQNVTESSVLFDAMKLDARLVPSEVVAREVYSRISSPMLWRFVQQVQRSDDAWSQAVVDRLVAECGPVLPALWRIDFTAARCPAVADELTGDGVRLGDLLRRPEDRDERLPLVPLLLVRADDTAVAAPDDDEAIRLGDQILFAGRGRARRGLEATLAVPSTASYVLTGRHIATGVAWRAVAGLRRRG